MSLDDKGELRVRRVASGRVLWRGGGGSLVAIDIVTSDYLEEFLEVVGRELALVEAACSNSPELAEAAHITRHEELQRTLSGIFTGKAGASGAEEE